MTAMAAPAADLPEVIDERTVAFADGARIHVPEAIERLPWKTVYCPTMPHQYVVSSWQDCDSVALDAILAMIRGSRQTMLAYWRGYSWSVACAPAPDAPDTPPGARQRGEAG